MATIALPISGLKLETSGAPILEKTASAAISVGQWLYASSGTEVAPADAGTNSTVVGIAILAADSGNPAYYVAADDVKLEGFAGMSAGQKYVLSGASGQMELLSDLTASENISYVATAETATLARVRIENTGLTA